MNSILNQAVVATVPTNSFPTHDDLAAVGALNRLREIEQLVDSFVASWHAPETILRGRGSYRVGYEKLLLIVPLDDQTQTPVGPAIEVSAQDLPQGDFHFSTPSPCPTAWSRFSSQRKRRSVRRSSLLVSLQAKRRISQGQRALWVILVTWIACALRWFRVESLHVVRVGTGHGE